MLFWFICAHHACDLSSSDSSKAESYHPLNTVPWFAVYTNIATNGTGIGNLYRQYSVLFHPPVSYNKYVVFETWLVWILWVVGSHLGCSWNVPCRLDRSRSIPFVTNIVCLDIGPSSDSLSVSFPIYMPKTYSMLIFRSEHLSPN